MKLFVGLGNPGDEYAKNRHNVGFMCVDEIASVHRLGPWKKKFQGAATEGDIAGERVMLLKPQTYMNESGRSVGEAARFLKIPVEDIVVFYDEIDLAPGKLKVKAGGGNAGHNGLRSISAHLDNDYVRVRIGVGHPGNKEFVSRWVLSDFAKADADWLEPLLAAIAQSCGRIANGDLARFMTDVATTIGAVAGVQPDPVPPTRKERGSSSKGADPDLPGKRHPAGEREGKRQSALADNLKKWLAGRKPQE